MIHMSSRRNRLQKSELTSSQKRKKSCFQHCFYVDSGSSDSVLYNVKGVVDPQDAITQSCSFHQLYRAFVASINSFWIYSRQLLLFHFTLGGLTRLVAACCSWKQDKSTAQMPSTKGQVDRVSNQLVNTAGYLAAKRKSRKAEGLFLRCRRIQTRGKRRGFGGDNPTPNKQQCRSCVSTIPNKLVRCRYCSSSSLCLQLLPRLQMFKATKVPLAERQGPYFFL